MNLESVTIDTVCLGWQGQDILVSTEEMTIGFRFHGYSKSAGENNGGEVR